jgi:hypothetical protein
VIHGQVADPSGALIPGAKIAITDAAGGNAASATSDALGNFQVKSLTPGEYLIQVFAEGFAPFQSATIPEDSAAAVVEPLAGPVVREELIASIRCGSASRLSTYSITSTTECRWAHSIPRISIARPAWSAVPSAQVLRRGASLRNARFHFEPLRTLRAGRVETRPDSFMIAASSRRGLFLAAFCPGQKPFRPCCDSS